jgi:hypothetical protein
MFKHNTFVSDACTPQILLLLHSSVRDRPLCLLLGGWCADLPVRALEEIPSATLAQVLPIAPSLVIRNCYHFPCVHSQYPCRVTSLNAFLSLHRHHRLLGPARFVCLFRDALQRYNQITSSFCPAAHATIISSLG